MKETEITVQVYNEYSQIFFENLFTNRRFGVEIVALSTISTKYNHYKTKGPLSFLID